jgi:SAM-dependent methyltransferase
MTAAEDYIAQNRANWNERADIHIADETGFYAIDRIVAGEITLTPIEREGIGDLTGLRVAHFQCHIGTDTIALLRLGAREVVGLDFSPTAIAHARALAERCGADIRYVEGQVTKAPELIGDGFDLVFTSWGTLGWHNDIPAWARAVAGVLKPGGRLYFADGHPMAQVFDDVDGSIRFAFDYNTPADRPIVMEEGTTYNGSETRLKQSRTFEWIHSVSRVLNALIAAGMEITAVGEHDGLPWRMYASLVRHEDGLWRLPEGHSRFPLSWSIKARKRG